MTSRSVLDPNPRWCRVPQAHPCRETAARSLGAPRARGGEGPGHRPGHRPDRGSPSRTDEELPLRRCAAGRDRHGRAGPAGRVLRRRHPAQRPGGAARRPAPGPASRLPRRSGPHPGSACEARRVDPALGAPHRREAGGAAHAAHLRGRLPRPRRHPPGPALPRAPPPRGRVREDRREGLLRRRGRGPLPLEGQPALRPRPRHPRARGQRPRPRRAAAVRARAARPRRRRGRAPLRLGRPRPGPRRRPRRAPRHAGPSPTTCGGRAPRTRTSTRRASRRRPPASTPWTCTPATPSCACSP